MRYGSLFSGVGGLDLAVEQVLGASCAWHSEIDPHASKVLAAHWPGVPNHGDITAIDWTSVEPVDVLCGGFPCQDISSAGRMAGIKEGTRSGLWYSYADAVRVLRPRLVVVENVGALLVRGLDIVLGSLADLGYVGSWRCLRASDVGAPHRRERVFLVAAPADAGRLEWPALRLAEAVGATADGSAGVVGGSDQGTDVVDLLPTPSASNPNDGEDVATWEARRLATKARTGNGNGFGTPLGIAVQLLPTPTTAPTTGNGHARSLGGEVASLLPTPTCSLGGSRGTPNRETARRRIEDEGRRGLDDAVALLLPTPRATRGGSTTEMAALLPTPTATDSRGSRGHLPDGTPYGPTSGTTLTDAVTSVAWGRYAAAVARWEHLTRPAPSPVDERGRLSAALPEWMMGFDAGWITDVLDRAPALRAAGNAVCHQQAAVAINDLLETMGRMT